MRSIGPNQRAKLLRRTRLIRGFDEPFKKSKFPYLSPLWGINNRLIKNFRMFGHYGVKEVKKYIRPEGAGLEVDPVFPQDSQASLLERLFPSSAGLVVNSSKSDKINRYLTPERIADILVLVIKGDIYDEQSNEMEILCNIYPKGHPTEKTDRKLSLEQLQILDPTYEEGDTRKKIALNISHGKAKLLKLFLSKKVSNSLNNITEKNQTSKSKIYYEPNTEDAQAIIEAFEFVDLLYSAFEVLKNKDKSDGITYSVAMEMLVTYMMEKYQFNIEKIKPYFYSLANAGLIDIDLVNQLWSKPFDYFNYDDYTQCTVEASVQLSMTERIALLNEGNAIYMDPFPPAIEYGISVVNTSEGRIPYSDCGDTMIRDLFMMFLYNNETGEFEVDKLYKLKEQGYNISPALINYFAKYCRTPAEANTEAARIHWSVVVNSLNSPDDQHKVRYICVDKEGKVFWGINAGLDNILLVVGKLLGEPKQFKMDMKFKIDCIQNLDLICHLFGNIEGDKDYPKLADRCWYFDICDYTQTSNMDVSEVSQPISSEGWIGVTIAFLYGDISHRNVSSIFELHCYPQHFAANRVGYRFASRDFSLRNPSFTEASFFADDATPEDMVSYIYESPMDTVTDRCNLLPKILHFTKKYNSTIFEFLLERWLNKKGTHFGEWLNPDIVKNVYKSLTEYLNIDEILALNIPQFFGEMIKDCICQDKSGLEKVLIAHNSQLKSSDSLKAKLLASLSPTLQDCNCDEFKKLSSAINKEIVSEVELLAHAVKLGNRYYHAICYTLGISEDSLLETGSSVLHIAIEHLQQNIVKELIKEGHDLNVQTCDGRTGLDICLEKLIYSFEKMQLLDLINKEHVNLKYFWGLIDHEILILTDLLDKLSQNGAKFNTSLKDKDRIIEWANRHASPRVKAIINVKLGVTSPSSSLTSHSIWSVPNTDSYWKRKFEKMFPSIYNDIDINSVRNWRKYFVDTCQYLILFGASNYFLHEYARENNFTTLHWQAFNMNIHSPDDLTEAFVSKYSSQFALLTNYLVDYQTRTDLYDKTYIDYAREHQSQDFMDYCYRIIELQVKHCRMSGNTAADKINLIEKALIFNQSTATLQRLIDENEILISAEKQHGIYISILTAASYGMVDHLKILNNYKDDIDHLNALNLMRLAIKANSTETTKFILENIFDVERVHNWREPLDIAISFGRPEIVKLLFSIGAHLITDISEEMALVAAFCVNNPDEALKIAQDAIKDKVHKNEFILELIEQLLSHEKFDLGFMLMKEFNLFNRNLISHTSLLHHYAHEGNIENVEYLYHHGASVETATLYELTPLHFAIFGNQPDMVEKLLDLGAKDTAFDFNNDTEVKKDKSDVELIVYNSIVYHSKQERIFFKMRVESKRLAQDTDNGSISASRLAERLGHPELSDVIRQYTTKYNPIGNK